MWLSLLAEQKLIRKLALFIRYTIADVFNANNQQIDAYFTEEVNPRCIEKVRKQYTDHGPTE